MKKIRVLVTGAGSGVGQGILKSLRISNLDLEIICGDIGPLNSALFRADQSILIPKVEFDGALESITSLLTHNKIDVVMVGSEFDLEFFSLQKEMIKEKTGALVIASDISTFRIANDKWETAEFLKNNNFPYAESYVGLGSEDYLSKAKQWGYPLILKSRTGTSSRNVHVVRNESDLSYHIRSIPDPMLQKLISENSGKLDNEYTCSIFKCNDDSLIGPFIARRTLRGGSSWHIEVGDLKELHPLIKGIGKKLSSMGSLNIQLMIGPEGAVPFEFNARFSGTTAVRSHFGFNEPEMAVRHFYLEEKLQQPLIKTGVAFRYLEEVFIDNMACRDLKEPFPKGMVRDWF